NKGLRLLLNAWKHLPALYPLQIVGDGPERAELQALASQLQLSQVTFRGRLPHAATLAAVKNAKFLIVPSTLFEGLPMCIVESFACGTPVLCSRLGGLVEIVEDKRTGLHFQPGDEQDLANKVTWAWDHPCELTGMGRAARQKYETDYTAAKNYSLLTEIYRQAMTASQSPGFTVPAEPPRMANSI